MAKVLVGGEGQCELQPVFAALRTDGFEVVRAEPTSSLLALLESEKPEFVVLDLMAPGANGIQLCRRIREEYPDVKVLLTSAYPLNLPQILRTDCGAFAFLQKPYDIPAILRLLHAEEHGPPSTKRGQTTLLRAPA